MTAHSMAMAQAQIDDGPLSQEGYAHLRSVIPAERTSAARDHLIAAYNSEHIQFVSKNLFPGYSLANPWPTDPVELGKIISEIPKHSVLEVCTTHGSVSLKARLHSEILDLILNNNSILELLRGVFGEDSSFYCHLAPAVRVIYPCNAIAIVPDHIDAGYNSHITTRDSSAKGGNGSLPFATLWIPLQGQSSTHGGLRVYPNTFISNSNLSDHSSSLWIPPITSFGSNSVIPNYSIGDCIVFHPWLLHGSAPNQTIATNRLIDDSCLRVSVDIRVFSGASMTSKHYMNLITGERYKPGDGPCAYR